MWFIQWSESKYVRTDRPFTGGGAPWKMSEKLSVEGILLKQQDLPPGLKSGVCVFVCLFGYVTYGI